MTEIVPRLLLGGAQDAERLASTVALVVNCTTDVPFFGDPMLQRQVRVPVKDNGDDSQQDVLARILLESDLVDDVLSTLEKGLAVLVHCRAGQQRSPAVVAACLLFAGRCRSVGDAITVVRARKPDAFLGAVNFRRALDLLERRV